MLKWSTMHKRWQKRNTALHLFSLGRQCIDRAVALRVVVAPDTTTPFNYNGDNNNNNKVKSVQRTQPCAIALCHTGTRNVPVLLERHWLQQPDRFVQAFDTKVVNQCDGLMLNGEKNAIRNLFQQQSVNLIHAQISKPCTTFPPNYIFRLLKGVLKGFSILFCK